MKLPLCAGAILWNDRTEQEKAFNCETTPKERKTKLTFDDTSAANKNNNNCFVRSALLTQCQCAARVASEKTAITIVIAYHNTSVIILWPLC